MTVKLMDKDEQHDVEQFEIEPEDRQRVYYVGGKEYHAARQDADGAWIYREV